MPADRSGLRGTDPARGSGVPLPSRLTAVAMEAESGCSRCSRRILLLEKAFLDENYAAVCVHCAASAYDLLWASRHLRQPEDFR